MLWRDAQVVAPAAIPSIHHLPPPSPAISRHLPPHCCLRSPKLRHVLTHIFASSDDADTILGFLGWHAPTAMEKNGFFLISVPEPPITVNEGATIDPRRVTGLKKHQYNFISYDTEAQSLTVRLSVARFKASLKVTESAGSVCREATLRAAAGRGQVEIFPV